jgi:hypothetical protein
MGIKSIVNKFLWQIDPLHKESRERIKKLENIHQGQRCFIIGNGPSLNKMDLKPLKNEFTFGLNRIYLLFPKIGFSTTYYVAVNKLVIQQCAEDIEKLNIPKFINWYSRKWIKFTDDMIMIKDPYDFSLGFSKDPSDIIWEGATVTYAAMQLAYYLGFKQVILIGVDHNFVTKGEPHKEIVSTGPDQNHFDSAYFGKGFRWQLPDLVTSEKAYKLAKKNFIEDNREIFDATVDGHLDIFPKVNFHDLF